MYSSSSCWSIIALGLLVLVLVLWHRDGGGDGGGGGGVEDTHAF